MDSGDWRRILPPPRRRPGTIAVVVRWRLEILALVGIGAAWYTVGGTVLGIVAGVVTLLVAFVPVVRSGLVRAWEMLMAPHRVRSALVEAGVAGRRGALPLVLWALPCGPGVVRVEVVLRSGTTVDDIRKASPVIRSSCGAAGIEIVDRPHRPDRATVLLARPRWGLP